MKSKTNKSQINPRLLRTAYCVLLTAFCLLPAAKVFAQALPVEGHWVLEKAIVLKITGSDTLTVDVNTVKDNSLIALYDVLIFEGNMLSIPLGDTYVRGEYNRTGNTIAISFMAAPHLLNYRLQDEKIYFTQEISFIGEDCVYLAQTVYKRN